MKSPSATIKSAVFTLLDGNVTYNSKKVPIFKHTPKNTESGAAKGGMFHYVEIGQIYDTETPRSADTFTHDISLDIDIVVGFPGFGSSVIPDDIEDQVMQLMNTTKGDALNLGNSFKCLYIYLENTLYNEAEGSHKIVTKKLRYRMEVDQI